MYQRKDKTWQDQLPIPGTKKYKYFYGKTKSEVKAKMSAWQAEQEKPQFFSAAADAWDTHHRGKVTPNAHSVYLAPLRRAVEYFGTAPMSGITADQINAFIRHIADQGFSKHTVQIHKNMLNMIFNHAIIQPGSQIRYNPCASVRIPSGLPEERREPPTDKQLEDVTPEGFGLFAWFLLYTGLRRGELLALRWEDIDRENMIIHVRREVTFESNQPVVVDRAKTPAGVREVDLLDILADALPKVGKGYIFGGDKPLTKTQFRKAWGKYCCDIGQGEIINHKSTRSDGTTYYHKDYKAYMTPHQFRHAYASMLDDAGIDETAAKTMLGHKSIVTTKNIYTHIRKGKRERSANQLNQYIANEKKG